MMLQEVELAIKNKIPVNIARENLRLEREIKAKEKLEEIRFKKILNDFDIDLL